MLPNQELSRAVALEREREIQRNVERRSRLEATDAAEPGERTRDDHHPRWRFGPAFGHLHHATRPSAQGTLRPGR